jgi:glucose/arabinose dehydrogenase
MLRYSQILAAATAALAPIDALHAQTPLTTERVASGLSLPLWIGAPAGDARLFVIEKDGQVRIVDGGVVLPTPFLDITAKTSKGSEQGLLGLAFHPSYASNGLFFVNYTDTAGDTVVSRFQVSAVDPDLADPASEALILFQDQPFENHNGGDLHFGLDGYLYVGFGDGGSQQDPQCHGQALSTWLGKLLRIDVDGAFPYAIPADNPFVGVPGALGEIWLVGLRNPWRWSVDRLTGDLYLGDVGQNRREEIDFAAAGVGGTNYGWKIVEGTRCNQISGCAPGTPACGDPSYVAPIYELFHVGFSGPLAIIGGAVYRGCAIPDLAGTYFFADFNDNKIRSFVYDPGSGVTNFRDRTTELAPGGGLSITSIAAFGTDGFGELYLADHLGGEIFQVVAAAPPAGFSDCDLDGRDDTCAIAADPDLDLDHDGTPDACQGLSADRGDVSAALQNQQTLFLHAPPSEANRLYVLAGSLSGTSPGFTLGSLHVPLNYDDYTDYTLLFANLPPLEMSFARLDSSAGATAAFNLEAIPLPPDLIGMTMVHLYVTIANGTGAYVSNFVELRLLP